MMTIVGANLAYLTGIFMLAAMGAGLQVIAYASYRNELDQDLHHGRTKILVFIGILLFLLAAGVAAIWFVLSRLE